MQSLAAMLARVERLWSDDPSDPETLIIHLREPDIAQCAACKTNLRAYASRTASAEAHAAREANPKLHVFRWCDDWTACPSCGAALVAVA